MMIVAITAIAAIWDIKIMAAQVVILKLAVTNSQ